VAENSPETPAEPGSPADYDVVLLIEQAMTGADARQVRSLHEGLDEPVTYHVLLPVDDAAARIEAAMGSVSGHDLVPGPSLGVPPADLGEIARESKEKANADLDATLAALKAAGADAKGQVVSDHPIAALAAKVAEVDGREAIILTRSHVVAEFFHVDWTSQARRKIGVPVLHLLEHENFDEQAGGGEGASLI
jgi:hypothetical protein